jgi:hypothetical protein
VNEFIRRLVPCRLSAAHLFTRKIQDSGTVGGEGVLVSAICAYNPSTELAYERGVG